MTERLHFHFSLSCIGEGNGNPLQCSCMENPREGGAWWAAVYGVAQSRTRLKRLSSSRIASIIQSRASKQIKDILICLELIPLCTTTYKSTKFLPRQEVNSSHFFHALVGKKYLYLSHEEWQIPHMWVHLRCWPEWWLTHLPSYIITF